MPPNATKPKSAGRRAEPLPPAEQKRRFEELARELGTDHGETLDKVFGRTVSAKQKWGDVAP